MSQVPNEDYMNASTTEIISATVLITILTTLLGLNIIFYLICKFIKRPRRNSIPADVKQVKRIKVKSASQISKDFEKEGLKMLMQQLQNSHSRRNSLSDHKDHADETDLGSSHNTDVVINVECESEVKTGNGTKNVTMKETSDSDIKELQCSTSTKGVNSGKATIFGKFASSLKGRNSKKSLDDKQLKRVNSKKLIKTKINNTKKYVDDLNLEDLSDSECTRKKSSKRLVKSQGGTLSKKSTSFSVLEQKKTEKDKLDIVSSKQNKQLLEINHDFQTKDISVEKNMGDNKCHELSVAQNMEGSISHELSVEQNMEGNKGHELPVAQNMEGNTCHKLPEIKIVESTTKDECINSNKLQVTGFHEDKVNTNNYHGNRHINNVVAITLTTEEGFQSKLELGSELDLKRINDPPNS